MPLSDIRSVHLPYCLKRQTDGRYVVLNREYKPLGFRTPDWSGYEKYPIAHRLKGLTTRKATRLSIDESPSLKSIYPYNDRSIPTSSAANMKAYLDRLAILAKIKCE